MNLSKLAQMANVSVSTVSKAFSDSHEISRQTKEMIFDVAKKYGCFDKYYKPVYPKKVIAVICPEMLGIHYTQMATFLSKEISMRNGTMLLSVDEFSSEKNQELIDYYTKFCRADGIIVIEPAAIIKNNTDVPIVQIGLDNEAKNVDCVNVIVNEAMDSALAYLIKNNYKKIKTALIAVFSFLFLSFSPYSVTRRPNIRLFSAQDTAKFFRRIYYNLLAKT